MVANCMDCGGAECICAAVRGRRDVELRVKELRSELEEAGVAVLEATQLAIERSRELGEVRGDLGRMRDSRARVRRALEASDKDRTILTTETVTLRLELKEAARYLQGMVPWFWGVSIAALVGWALVLRGWV